MVTTTVARGRGQQTLDGRKLRTNATRRPVIITTLSSTALRAINIITLRVVQTPRAHHRACRSTRRRNSAIVE
jgi:hypothetical protein